MQQEEIARSAVATIKIHMDTMTASERRVAQYVMQNPEAVLYQTLKEMAEQAKTSDATVMRFIRSIGFSSFNNFKFALAQDAKRPNEEIFDDLVETDGYLEIARKVIASDIVLLQDTLQLLEREAFEKTVNAIREKEVTYIFATGTSVPSANWLYDRLFRLGIEAHAVTDPYQQLTQGAVIPKESEALCIFISRSGSPAVLVETQQLIRRRCPGVTIITITCFPDSQLAQGSECVLIAGTHEEQNDIAGSQVAIISILNALYICLANVNTERTSRQQAEIWEATMPLESQKKRTRKSK